MKESTIFNSFSIWNELKIFLVLLIKKRGERKRDSERQHKWGHKNREYDVDSVEDGKYFELKMVGDCDVGGVPGREFIGTEEFLRETAFDRDKYHLYKANIPIDTTRTPLREYVKRKKRKKDGVLIKETITLYESTPMKK